MHFFFFIFLLATHPLTTASAEDYHQQYLAKPGARPYCSAEPLEIDLPPISEWVCDGRI